MAEEGRMNPFALATADVARLLSRAGGVEISIAQIEADVAAGVPTNPDGTISLVVYCAWLVKGCGHGD